jgi:hypothetical protein
MAEFADMGDATERYAAIERAYCEDRWPVVIDQGGRLLSQLDPQDLGLRQRLQLLMAHSYLYGFGERDAAEDLYRAVLESKAEASLRRIAAQGLEQCELQPLPAGGAAVGPLGSEPAAVAPVNPKDLPQPASAPSLKDDGGASLHDSVQALIPVLPGESPAPRTSAPVMPWLETTAAAAAAASLPWEQDPGGSADEPSPAPRETLEPEVIDEPELIEVHQADPTLAEEIELKETDGRGALPQAADSPLIPEVDPVVTEEGPEPPADVETTPNARTAIPAATAGLEQDDPDPAEDADLRQGLLRVEIL